MTQVHRVAAAPGIVALAVVVGLVIGLGTTGCAVGRAEGGAGPASPTSASPDVSASPATEAQRVGSVAPQAPRVIELPNGHKMNVAAVSTTGNGLLDVPSNIQAAGWWQGGSKIGDPFGSTLIAAHVDSLTQGLGPFSALLGTQPGDQVVVWSKGLRQIFRVVSLHLRPRSAVIGARSSLHSPSGPRRLTLVTCAGPYVRSQGGYQNLAVVTAVPAGEPISRSSS